MANYRHRQTGEVKNQGQWRKHYSNHSLPRVWNQDILDFIDLDLVVVSATPEYNPRTQHLVSSGYTQDEEGNWTKGWTVQDLTEEEINANSDRLAESQRSGRNQLLEETDWWAVSDRTMTAEETAYRQALRDITTHANWPNLEPEDWPTKPE